MGRKPFVFHFSTQNLHFLLQTLFSIHFFRFPFLLSSPQPQSSSGHFQILQCKLAKHQPVPTTRPLYNGKHMSSCTGSRGLCTALCRNTRVFSFLCLREWVFTATITARGHNWKRESFQSRQGRRISQKRFAAEPSQLREVCNRLANRAQSDMKTLEILIVCCKRRGRRSAVSHRELSRSTRCCLLISGHYIL